MEQDCHEYSSAPSLDLWSLSPMEGLSVWSRPNKGADSQLHWQCAAIRGWSVAGPRSSLCSILGLQAICHEQNFFGSLPCNRTSHWHLGLDIILVTWRRSQLSRQQTASNISLGCNSVTPPSWHLHLAKVQGQPHPCSGEQPLCVPAHTLCL